MEPRSSPLSSTAREARIELSNEWHARPPLELPAPFRCSHVVTLTSEGELAERRREFGALCADFGRPGPAEGARYHASEIGTYRIKWEGHTEAVSHTILVPGQGAPPFGECAIDFVEPAFREHLLGSMFVGVHVEVVRPPGEADPFGYELARSLLGSDSVYGGYMSARTAVVWSAFTLDARGFVRILIVDLERNDDRIARLLQRLLDLETYRMLAMLALPEAREVMGSLSELEPELDEIVRRLAEESEEGSYRSALSRIIHVAAQVEHLLSSRAYRFAAARAYRSIVERRCTEVQDEVLGDHQRYTNFLLRSFQPALRTCDAAERRAQDLAERVSRAAELLDTRVDLIQQEQSRQMLASMARSARMQVKLQQAVEGFSIVAISYYGVGLLAYVLKSAKALGWPVDPDLLSGLGAPLVVAAVWWTVRRVRRSLDLRHEAEEIPDR